MKTIKYRNIVYILTGMFIFLNLSLSDIRGQEQCLMDAWEAFNQNRYERAIQSADICIDEFRKDADKAQSKLAGTPEPPEGRVDNDNERRRIFEQGLLNDVATAYYIKGRSAEYLYRATRTPAYKETAENAYTTTCQYKHARTWDPKGWFWSPCEAASKRLPLE